MPQSSSPAKYAPPSSIVFTHMIDEILPFVHWEVWVVQFYSHEDIWVSAPFWHLAPRCWTMCYGKPGWSHTERIMELYSSRVRRGIVLYRPFEHLSLCQILMKVTCQDPLGTINHLERFNFKLRQVIARFVRQTLSFSKSPIIHNASLRLFLWKYHRRIEPKEWLDLFNRNKL